MRFDEIRYVRPDMASVRARYDLLKADVAGATPADAPGLFSRWLELDAAWIASRELIRIGTARDTGDAALADEKRFFDDNDPLVKGWNADVARGLLREDRRAALEPVVGTPVLDILAGDIEARSDEIADLLAEQNRLVTEYERGEALDQVFEGLVAVRTAMAGRLGHADYIDLGARATRLVSITRNHAARFCNLVREQVVPWAIELHELTARAGSRERLEGFGSRFDLDGHVEVFESLSPRTGAFLRQMVEGGWIDADDRPEMRDWGECFFPPTHGMPFVFARLGRSWGDVPLLIHELGHAFWYHTVADDPRSSYAPAAEFDEIPSMALVYLTYPWMERLFGDLADDYRLAMYHHRIRNILFCACVDEFESFVYANPDCGIEGRNAKWDALRGAYRFEVLDIGWDWRSWGVPSGLPLYTLTYATSDLLGQQLWMRQAADPQAAIDAYVTMCERSTAIPFFELLAAAELDSPFEESTVRATIEHGRRWIAGR